ncbi:hypothetical protein B0T22DRAFT_445900 [Podospora appendiculata]|uniref:DUF6536 domain-containing protein n=1 Tax=Podospora appendiculata TaxID=314037 RepID=A0AAE1C725_9PEZI|nr:hypothetical protein B0T22DRAFT_445900 [Podospora appendiculata]
MSTSTSEHELEPERHEGDPPETGRDSGKEVMVGPKKAASIKTDAGPGEETESFRAERFADKTTLSWWFPRILDDEKNNRRIWLSRRGRALLLHFGLVTLIFAANLSLTVYAVLIYGSEKGVGLIYQGECATVKTLDQWIHLVINLLGTAILSASNYCMQLQVSPTRADVDQAHAHGKWLNIGVPSLRNLAYTSNWRRLSWLLLGFSSVPVHLMYNSAVFQSISSHDYTIAVSPWVNPPSFNNTEIIHGMQQDAIKGLYQKMNLSSCFDLYDDYWQPQGNALIFVKNESVQTPFDDSLLIYVSIFPRSDDWAKNMWALENGTVTYKATSPPRPVNKWFVGTKRYEVSHCLVQPPGELISRCRLEYSPYIMFAVCVLNLMKAGVIFSVWFMRKRQRPQEKEVLYTLGDAIASFMRRPDPATKDMCLAAKFDFEPRWIFRDHRLIKEKPLMPSQEPRHWEEQPRRWMAAVSPTRWAIFICTSCLVILVCSVLLGQGMADLRHRNISITLRSLWDMGFGALTPYTYLVIGLPRDDPTGLIMNVILSNLPQLTFSIVYILHNGVLSTFLVQLEFSRMYTSRKPLRVSEPAGIQRSSYFISLPMRYGIPHYLCLGLMHWLLSQSLFLARITALFPSGEVDPDNSFSTCGYSPMAVITGSKSQNAHASLD